MIYDISMVKTKFLNLKGSKIFELQLGQFSNITVFRKRFFRQGNYKPTARGSGLSYSYDSRFSNGSIAGDDVPPPSTLPCMFPSAWRTTVRNQNVKNTNFPYLEFI